MNRFIFVIFSLLTVQTFSQNGPNLGDGTPLSGNSSAANRFSDQINLFTGQPDISVPLFSYSNNNGIGISISLHYIGTGGIHMDEPASMVGLGWYLSAGGAVTRTIRGVPDDVPQKGFLYTTAIPTDFRSNADKYYYDTLDSQQDVFQFNFNGISGKFYIRRNKEIVLVPFSNLKVQPEFDPNPSIGKITSFTIITEDGTRYLFKDVEGNSLSGGGMHAGYSGYYTAWNLTQIISPFKTDTIKLTYTGNTSSSSYGYPAVYFLKPPYTTVSNSYIFNGNQTTTTKKIASISLPNKQTINFIYSGDFVYADNDAALDKITISDSIFRTGFYLNYLDTLGTLFLKSVTPFTAKEKRKSYEFYYKIPLIKSIRLRTSSETTTNIDDWGFYLGRIANLSSYFLNNSNYPGMIWENRTPDLNATLEKVLTRMVLPEGGNILYDYELNAKYPSVLVHNFFSVPANSSATKSITFTNTFTDNHVLSFKIDTNLLRTQSPPLSGTCTFMCKIKSASNPNIIYDSVSISLYDLYYNGLKNWTVHLPNGNYQMETKFKGSGSVTTPFSVYITWYNHTDPQYWENPVIGGLRIRQITFKNDYTDTNPVYTKTYLYVTEDGKSSGIIGEIPMSAYDYRHLYVSNTTYAEHFHFFYKGISQQPMNVFDFSQGSPVGYSRVEVINGTPQKNAGKEVHEFTTLRESGGKNTVPDFPYAPIDLNDWALGLPASVKIYDSTGTLLKKTTMQYDIRAVTYNSADDRNLKLGLSEKIDFEDASYHTVSVKNVYTGQDYYPVSGRVFQTFIFDTVYQKTGSPLTTKTEFQYDTVNYLVKKVITPYDRTRGLNLEKRFYYPQDYTIGGAIGKMRDSDIVSTVIATEEWITGDANPRIISGTITNFSELASKHIVPMYIYKLQTNAPVSQSTIGVFNPASLVRNNTYFVQQVSLPAYYNNGVAAQTNNVVTGISSAIILDYNLQYVVAKAENASYSDISYTSFESDGSSGTWTVASTNRDYSNALTGKRSYNLSNGNVTKTGLSTAKTYIVTIWAKSGASLTINGGGAGSAITTQNGWSLYSRSFTGITSITISGSGLIDELRLHPKDANMISYTYEPTVGVTSTNDANNTITYTEYDNLNRVKVIRDRNKNIIQKYQYSDSIYPVSIQPIWQVSGIKCKANFQYDSLYRDSNPYSQTYKDFLLVTPQTIDSCACPPENYKCINGNPEAGVRINKSTTRINASSWQCVYYYIWSDCSISQDYTVYSSTACSVSSGGCQ